MVFMLQIRHGGRECRRFNPSVSLTKADKLGMKRRDGLGRRVKTLGQYLTLF